MSPLRPALIATVLTVVWLTPACFALDPIPKNWTGQLVVGKKPAKDIKFSDNSTGTQVSYEFRGMYPLKVREDLGGWLRLFDGHKEGWADKDDFILSKDAVSYFTDRINANEKDGFAWSMRAIAWYDRGEFDNAIKDNTECIRLIPKNSKAFNRRGSSWVKKKEYDRAIQDYDEAIRLDPKDAFAFNNRGIVWSYKKDYDRAIQDYDEAIRLDPKYAIAFNNRGNGWNSKKDYDQAIKDFDEAIRLNPKYVNAFVSRGIAWRNKKDYDRAIKDYNEAIRLDRKDAWGFYGRALVQMIGRRPESIDGFRKVLELQGYKGDLSTYAVIKGHLTARRVGNGDAAKLFLSDSAGKLTDAWPYPLVQFLCGDLDEAAVTKLATDTDKQTEARYVLGQVAALNGKMDEASVHFRWIKEKGTPTFTEYRLAVAELDELERGKK